jgi:zinc protease
MSIVQELPSLTSRVHEADAGHFQVFALRTPVERVVSFEASFRTDPDFAAEEEVQQQLAIALLDKGTLRRDRFALAEALDDRGAQLGFSADGLRCSVSGRCLSEDLPYVLHLVSEQLREPLFDAEEFRKARAQQVGAVRRIMDDTGSQSHGALVRRFYEPAHPNYRPELEEDLAHVQSLTVESVRDYHASHFGARDAAIALAGDLDPEEATEAVRAALADWHAPQAAGAFSPGAIPAQPGRTDVPMGDKPNLDVRIGQPVGLRRDDPDYLPLYVAIYILGGNFSARLMNTIRDEQGLTYGIGARLAGVGIEHDAYFLTSVTLSADVLQTGIDATLEQIERFITGGITDDELEEKKTTINGSFKVGMATTRGLASVLLGNAERGFAVDYLDSFPGLIEELTTEQVNDALRRHLDPSGLHIAVAGSLPS